MEDEENGNFEIFRECLFSLIAEKSSPTRAGPRKRQARLRSSIAGSQQHNEARTVSSAMENDAADLVDFSDYIAKEAFENLPIEFTALSYQMLQNDSSKSDVWSLPLSLGTLEELTAILPPTVADSLSTYGLIDPPESDLQSFMSPVFASYVAATTAAPPKWSETRKSACEICERDWVPMTYHHLIPKQIHAKVMKRGWHDESRLNSVAWLCRACHSFVHKMASNEELAREWFTVERICEREDVQKWAAWVRKIRWKKK